jgi:prepilin-type N-terminal cleavage/methylation domain-containing protein
VNAEDGQKGFTLLEMMISLCLFCFCVIAIATFLLDSTRLNRRQQMAMTIQADARNCLEMVTNVMRSAGWDPRKAGFTAVTLNAIDPASADHIEIRADLNEDGVISAADEDVLIRLNGNNLEWRKTAGGQFVVLASDITNDENGDGNAEMMFTPDSVTNPTKVTVKITAQSPVPDSRTGKYVRYTVTDVVALRGNL